MSDNQNWSRAGEQIIDAVTDALQSGDFKNLNHLVSQTVVNTLDEVGIHITPRDDTTRTKDQYNCDSSFKNGQTHAQTDIPLWKQEQQMRQKEQQMHQKEQQMRRQEQQIHWQQQQLHQKAQQIRWQEQQIRRQQQGQLNCNPNFPQVNMKKVGNVSNVLYQVFGGIGLGFTGLITLVRLILLDSTTVSGWVVNFIFLFFFFFMIRFGISQKRRLKRAQRYIFLCGQKMFEDIDNLAKNTGKSERHVIKDLQKMLHLGFFPEGHLDNQNTCFMLNDVVYRQYLEAENNRMLREEENRSTLEQKEHTQTQESVSAPEGTKEQDSELNTMVAEGMEYIRKLRDLNDKIAGEIISAKLFRLESLLKEIFDSIKEHPEQMHRMHKLMDYYLPTTLKLVEAYEDFDQISTPGEEILKAKAEIENTLDTINQAFTELINNLFQDAAFDATTDAQVLKSMLAREGLMREMEFATNKEIP